MSLRKNWHNNDYRAITIGLLLLVVSSVLIWVAPSWSLTCDRPGNRCDLRSTDSSLKVSSRSIPFQDIKTARETCRCSGGQKSCACTVDLVLEQENVVAFAGLTDESSARILGNEVRTMLSNRVMKTGRVDRASGRGFGYALLFLSLLFIVLGVRNNMVASNKEELPMPVKKPAPRKVEES